MKKIKLISVILALVLMISCFAACGGTTEDPTTTAAPEETTAGEAVTATKLVMGSSCDFPPYEFVGDEDGEYIGIDVEIAQGFCEKNGYELEIQDMEFKSIIAAVNTGAVDFGMSGFTITEERKNSVSFSNPYEETFQSIIVKEGSEIKGKEDLEGKTIGVQAGTTGDDFVTKDFGEDAVNQYDKYTMAITALLNDQVDCVVLDDAVADAFVEANEGLTKLETPYGKEEYAVAFNFEDTELLEQFNAYLAEIKEDGTLDGIFAKYKTEDEAEDETAADAEETSAEEVAEDTTTEAAEDATEEAAEKDTSAAE